MIVLIVGSLQAAKSSENLQHYSLFAASYLNWFDNFVYKRRVTQTTYISLCRILCLAVLCRRFSGQRRHPSSSDSAGGPFNSYRLGPNELEYSARASGNCFAVVPLSHPIPFLPPR